MAECSKTSYVFNQGIINKLCNQDSHNNICKITFEQKKKIIELLLELRHCKNLPLHNYDLCTSKIISSGNFGFIIGVGKFAIKFEFNNDSNENVNEYYIHNLINQLKKYNIYYNKLNMIINNKTETCKLPLEIDYTIDWKKYSNLNNLNMIITERGENNLNGLINEYINKPINEKKSLMTKIYSLFEFYETNLEFFDKYKKYFIHYDIKSNNILSINGILKFIDFGLSMMNDNFFMNKEDVKKYLEKHNNTFQFPKQHNYLFKNKKIIFENLTLNFSPLIDIFSYIIVIIESYLKLFYPKSESLIMAMLYNNFASIKAYEKMFDVNMINEERKKYIAIILSFIYEIIF